MSDNSEIFNGVSPNSTGICALEGAIHIAGAVETVTRQLEHGYSGKRVPNMCTATLNAHCLSAKRGDELYDCTLTFA